MKVILQQDVAKVGRRGETVTVADGYGLNKLIPQGMAVPATVENVKKQAASVAKHQADRELADEKFAAAVSALGESSVSLTVEANEDGKMYQALKVVDIVAAMEAKGVSISVEQIMLKNPIKTTGEHIIELVSGEIVHPVTLAVTAS